MEYSEFIESKLKKHIKSGFDINESVLNNKLLKKHRLTHNIKWN